MDIYGKRLGSVVEHKCIISFRRNVRFVKFVRRLNNISFGRISQDDDKSVDDIVMLSLD